MKNSSRGLFRKNDGFLDKEEAYLATAWAFSHASWNEVL